MAIGNLKKYNKGRDVIAWKAFERLSVEPRPYRSEGGS
jgi:hypothetical protein